MSRIYEMAAGAVIDAEGRTVVNGVVSIYDAETAGTVIAPSVIRQADGSAWPLEGVKTDANGKVKLQWPDSAGDEPTKLWVDTSRGRWPLEPADISARLAAVEENPGGGAALNERGDYTEAQADDPDFAVGDVFSWEGGRYAVFEAGTGDTTPDLEKTILLGADTSAVPVTVAEDEDEDTFTLAFLLPSGKYGVVTGTRSDDDGGGGDFDPADITYEWGNANCPSSAANWPDTIGGVDAVFGLDLNGGSAYVSTAFANHGGLKLFNDGLAAHLTAPITLDVETGWGCAYSVIEDFGTDATADGAEVILFALQDDGRVPPVCRVMFRMTEAGPGDGTGKAYAWVVEATGQPELVVSVGSLTGLDSSAQVVNAIHSVALHFKGSASYLAIDGTQVGATIDLTGLDGVTYLDLNPHSGEGALLRGFQTIGSFGLTDDTMTEAATKAWVADRLAALVA